MFTVTLDIMFVFWQVLYETLRLYTIISGGIPKSLHCDVNVDEDLTIPAKTTCMVSLYSATLTIHVATVSTADIFRHLKQSQIL